MQNRRKLIRVETGDFLEIRPLGEVGKKISTYSKNITPMGICFTSEIEWRKGTVLFIDYFLPEEFDSVKLKATVVWSEFINNKQGYFCGAQIIQIEKEKEEKFLKYYQQKLGEI
ncbi:MAG: PilZ domain-containing protein [Candidatus Omnitrophica bacterium]|nr:PilZ domain-containing protein [Candidatus Omnitrophota bacterium]MCM8831789.1 PilZ domain-containing protein [Candidatus Omnitrophota bacterium]